MSTEQDIKTGTTTSTTSSDRLLSHEMVRLVLPEIVELIEQDRHADISAALQDWHEPDLADLLEDLEEPEQRVAFFRAWKRDIALKIFEEVSIEIRAELLDGLTHRERLWLLNAMSPDERADLFAEVEDEERGKLSELLSPKARADIERLLSYPEESAGSLMTTSYVVVGETATVDEATRTVRQVARYAETIYTVYVVDTDGVLVGVLGLRTLMLAPVDALVRDIMETSVISVGDMEDQEEVAHKLRTYDLTAVPVVDDAARLIGIITVDDVLDVIRVENTEDTYRMAAIQESEKPYLDTPPWRIARQRAPWLMILVLAGFLSGGVIEYYEVLLSQVVILMFFVPVLAGTGGNAGIQVATTVVRSMATHELGPGDVLSVVKKEFAVALLIGAVLAVIMMFRAYFVDTNWALLGTVGLAMMAVVFVAIIIGGLLPLGLKRMGFDPALMSSPFITTMIDSIALIIYFEIARRLIMI